MSNKDLSAFDASEANEQELTAVTGGSGKVLAEAHVAEGGYDAPLHKQPGRGTAVGEDPYVHTKFPRRSLGGILKGNRGEVHVAGGGSDDPVNKVPRR